MTKTYINDACWQELANAIVIQAVNDYRKLCRKERKEPLQQSEYEDKKRIQRFFCGWWFETLTDINGFELLKRLDAETTYIRTHIYL